MEKIQHKVNEKEDERKKTQTALKNDKCHTNKTVKTELHALEWYRNREREWASDRKNKKKAATQK